MRPLLTWLLIGTLFLIGLFAARDAFQSEGTSAAPAASTKSIESGSRAPAGPPAIPGRLALVTELKKLGARGALYVTDVSCRRFILSLPTLAWTTDSELPGSDCGFWTRQPSDADTGIAARQVNADTVEVTSGGWSFGFEGTSPAFRPNGILTFVRHGRLREWTGRCPETAQRVVFRGLHDVARCDRPIAGSPRDVREVAWLTVRDYAVVAGPDGATSLEIVRGRSSDRLFNSVGARMGALDASPGGRYVVVRIDGTLTPFQTESKPGVRPLPGSNELARSIAWSRDERLAALATQDAITVFPAETGRPAVRIPVSVARLQWR
jgi:hypothetical protein